MWDEPGRPLDPTGRAWRQLLALVGVTIALLWLLG